MVCVSGLAQPMADRRLTAPAGRPGSAGAVLGSNRAPLPSRLRAGTGPGGCVKNRS